MTAEQLRLQSLTGTPEISNTEIDAWPKHTAFAFLWGMDSHHSTLQAGCFVAMSTWNLA